MLSSAPGLPDVAGGVRRGALLPEQSVLIVEDDDEVREVLELLLASEGFRVRLARNGREALDVLHTMGAVPQVILLDLMMPIMNGAEFLTEARKETALAAIPVVVMSAYGHLADDIKDVSAFIKKPVDVARLLSTLRRCVSDRLS